MQAKLRYRSRTTLPVSPLAHVAHTGRHNEPVDVVLPAGLVTTLGWGAPGTHRGPVPLGLSTTTTERVID